VAGRATEKTEKEGAKSDQLVDRGNFLVLPYQGDGRAALRWVVASIPVWRSLSASHCELVR
jgi:hypothetical protein